MMFGDEPIPKSVVVEGVYTSALFFKRLVEKGIRIFEDVRLNPDTDLVLATYPRTGIDVSGSFNRIEYFTSMEC